MGMREALGEAAVWGTAAIVVLLLLFGAWTAWDARRRRARGEKPRLSAGGIAAFDEVWRPTAAEAHAVWEAEQITPAPSPIPGDGPGVISAGRIVIETGVRPPRP